MGNRTVLRSSDCQNHREMKRIKYSKEEERWTGRERAGNKKVLTVKTMGKGCIIVGIRHKGHSGETSRGWGGGRGSKWNAWTAILHTATPLPTQLGLRPRMGREACPRTTVLEGSGLVAAGTPGTRFLLVRDVIRDCIDQRGQLSNSLREATKGGKHCSWNVMERCLITPPLELGGHGVGSLLFY